MALVTDQEMFDYLEEDDTSSTTPMISTLKGGVEAWVKRYCDRDFEVTSYKERYDGDGTNTLILRQYPVTAITRLSLWPADVIRVWNTATSTIATVSVTSTGVTLSKDGVDTSLTFAANATFQAIVNAINALSAQGWAAALVSTSFANFLSTELIERMGLYCLETTYAYLQMPYQRAEVDFDVDSERGIIHLFRYWIPRDYDFGNIPFREMTGFPRGTRNIFVNYSAGFSTIPEDLKLAVKIIVKYIYQRKDEEMFGSTSFSTGGISTSFEQMEFPKEAKMILDLKYRKAHL